MFTMNVAHGHRDGSDTRSARQPGAGGGPHRAAGENGRQFTVVVAEQRRPTLTVGDHRQQGERRIARRGQNCAMAANPRAGKPALPRTSSTSPPGDRVLHGHPDPGRRGPAGGVRDLGTSRVEPGRCVQRGAHPGDHAGHRRVPRRAGTTGPLFIGRDTHGLSEPAWVSALEVLAANDVVAMIDSARPLHPDAGRQPRHPSPTTAAAAIWPTASWSPRRTTRPRTAGSSTTRPTAGRPTPTPPGQSRPRQRDPPRRAARGEAPLAGARAEVGATGTTTRRLRRRSAERRRHPRHPPGRPDRRRPAGRGERRLLGAIAERHTWTSTVVNPLVDATWRFMTLDTDGKIRWTAARPTRWPR